MARPALVSGLLLLSSLLLVSGNLPADSVDPGADPVDPARCRLTGPGLRPDEVVLPARYFFIQTVDKHGNELTSSPDGVFEVSLSGDSARGPCHVNMQTLDRHDGTVMVRYRVFVTCRNAVLRVLYRGQHVADSPYKIDGPIYAEECPCPVDSLEDWLASAGCPASHPQIERDLSPYHNVDFDSVLAAATSQFSHAGSQSFCNYVVKDNQIHRRCYGKYVGFHIFMDAILLSLTRKARLPDLELLINLGDWPLVRSEKQLALPMFSWCGSTETDDIVLPTYELTEASVECMGRVMLDMLSVQSKEHVPWEQKQNMSFWRGRDSRRERLRLVDISRERPDLVDAALTHFFFFKAEEKTYGPTQPRISFFDFFKYKYQLSVDGTVAAYRFPFLLAGGSLVVKQKSDYYEHFYNEMKPGVHYLEVAHDLSDLVEKLEWAKAHDVEARRMAEAGRRFAQQNLMPLDIYCYHAVAFKEWATRLRSPVRVREGMEPVTAPDHDRRFGDCECHRSRPRDEL
ncbi:protein O-glucosyltransferase 2-like [Amphibalanus amphitrite]|uniref:protein O-glucosyltransferase 2-like n=1 Tax=Amphibalanus amphitrite TaxID=1232801 RepID=UPI001C90AAAE|nr:protein O-glucosyltransferase 2-like [Amphibalanus amphitrite]